MNEATKRRQSGTLRWLISLGAKFARVVPVYTAGVAVTTLVSQLALLFAFLLPLKVVILMGSSGIPSYFPAFLADIDHGNLILLLSVSAGLSYLLYLLADRGTLVLVDRGASLLLQRSRKILVFENQNQVAAQAYKGYANGLAALIFVLIGSAFYVVFYPRLSLWLFLSLATAAITLVSLRSRPGFVLASGVKVAADLGFLGAFAFMVADYIWGSWPGNLLGIISLILVRQWIQRLSTIATNVSMLGAERERISAIFFHGQALLPHAHRAGGEFWQLSRRSVREAWIARALGHAAIESEIETIRWRQTGTQGVSAFDVVTTNGDRYLVRLFAAARIPMAEHERSLFVAFKSGVLPAPEFLACGEEGGCPYHIYRSGELVPLPPGTLGQQGRVLAERLMAIEPPASLVDRYERSRSMLWERLNEAMLDRLSIAVNDETDKMVLDAFSRVMPELREALRQVPLQVRNAGQTADTLSLADGGLVVTASWVRWTLDPIGCGWPVESESLVGLGLAVSRAADARPILADKDTRSFELAALAFELDRRYQNQQYASALNLCGEITERLVALRSPGKSLATGT